MSRKNKKKNSKKNNANSQNSQVNSRQNKSARVDFDNSVGEEIIKKISNKEKTEADHIRELRKWYNDHQDRIEKFESSNNFVQLIDPKDTTTKTEGTFSRERLRTFMRNPYGNTTNLRNLSRFLYRRSQVYRRIINYNASMIDLNYRSVIPLIDLTKDNDKDKTIKSYYDTLQILEVMNLPLEMYKAYIIAWREDVFYGCVYFDLKNNEFFVLPLDPDYCKVTGIYPTGDLGFDYDMTYFSQRQDILEMWGEPFTTMYRAYESDTVNGRWQPMPDENCICFKVNFEDYQYPLPPYMGLFNALINLEDLNDITAVANEQMIYKLLVAKLPTITGTNEVDDFSVDPQTAIQYFQKLKEILPDYSAAVLSPLAIDTVSFDNDQTTDVDKVENATKSVLNISGGAQVLNSSTISGTTAWNGAIRADEELAMSSLLPQTQAWCNRFLGLQIKNPAKVKFIETTRYTVNDYKDKVMKDATYGLPTKILLNSLNDFSELETLSLNFLEEDCLNLSEKLVPLQSSNTMNTGDLRSGSDNPEGGAPEKSDTEITDDGEASREKRETSRG